ncbi:hypothetical protein D3C87_2015670 [compost metagenome]
MEGLGLGSGAQVGLMTQAQSLGRLQLRLIAGLLASVCGGVGAVFVFRQVVLGDDLVVQGLGLA